MNVPPYLWPIYNIIKKSFGDPISQHQYEGLIVFLYEYMSNRNIGLLLSLLTDKHRSVITLEVDTYFNQDKTLFEDVKASLDSNGFEQWATSFEFQVIHHFVKDGILYVEGRFIEGQILRIGDTIHSIRTDTQIEPVNMQVVSIEMYNQQVEFIDLGMTGRLGLKTDRDYKPDSRFILSSAQL